MQLNELFHRGRLHENVSTIHTDCRLQHTAVLHKTDVQVPDHVMLRDWKRLEGAIEHATRCGDFLLLHQKFAVSKPDFRHFMHVHHRRVEILVHFCVQFMCYHQILALHVTIPNSRQLVSFVPPGSCSTICSYREAFPMHGDRSRIGPTNDKLWRMNNFVIAISL